ncbi:MAG: hypothetical protein AAF108_02795 [Planctomycetota bacterium]
MPSIYDIHQSRWLKVNDLMQDEVTVTVDSWGKEDVRHPETNKMEPLWFLRFRGLPKPLKLSSKQQCELIADLLGSPELDDWVGKQLVLGRVTETHGGDRWHLVRVLRKKPARQPRQPVVGPKHAPNLISRIKDAGLTVDTFIEHLKRTDTKAYEAVHGKEVAEWPADVTREHLRTWIEGNRNRDDVPIRDASGNAAAAAPASKPSTPTQQAPDQSTRDSSQIPWDGDTPF